MIPENNLIKLSWKQTLNSLIAPSDFIGETERRRQARLLSALLLALSLVGILSTVIEVLVDPAALFREPDPIMGLIGAVVLLGIYVLSRTRYYTLSAGMTVGLLFIIIHAMPIVDEAGSGWYYYAILPILLSGILFSLPVLVATAIVSMGSMLLLVTIVPQIRFDLYWTPIVYILIITVTLVAFVRHRDLVQKDRRLELEKTNEHLQREVTERKQAETERARLQQQLLESQQQVIRELSSPIIPIMDQILVMPLVGTIDSMRAREIMRALLTGIGKYRAEMVILDITGMPVIDSDIAAHLDKTIKAARLKGARVIVTGVSDAVAETIVDLGIDWRGINVMCDLQTGLVAALNSMRIKLTK